jgi:hypothetical protein
MANNINKFGYTGNHGKNWGARVDGENQTLAGGLNLSYNAEGSNRYFLSYLASTNKKELEETRSTENYLPQGTYYQQSVVNEEERTTPHKLNLGLRHKFNEQHNLILDGDLSISSNTLSSQGLTNSGIEDARVNSLTNSTHTASSVIDAEAEGSYVFKFNEGRTQFKTEASVYYHRNKSLLNWRDTIELYNPDSMDLFIQFRDEYSDRAGFILTPGVVQRIKQFWFLSAGLELGMNTEHLNWQQDIERGSGESVDTILPSFGTRDLWAGPSLSIKRNSNKSQIEFILKASWNQLDKFLDEVSLEKPTYFYLQPGFNYEYKYRTGRRINVRYSTNVNMPSVNQLYPVANTLNLLSIYQGNLDLRPEYSHNLSASWWYFDQFSFTSLFARLGATHIRDKIGWSQSTNEELITHISPINTTSHNSIYSYISFSTPIRALGIKISLTSHENWNKGWSIINGEDNTQTNFIHSLGLRFENRKKEKWDVSLGANASITDAKFSISSMNTVYYNTSLFTDIRFTPSEKWSFETKASVVNYNSRSFDEAVSIPLITAGISYYFLRGERASITLRGYDLLNKQLGFERNSQTNYLLQREWNTIGRYVMLEFHLRIGR